MHAACRQLALLKGHEHSTEAVAVCGATTEEGELLLATYSEDALRVWCARTWCEVACVDAIPSRAKNAATALQAAGHIDLPTSHRRFVVRVFATADLELREVEPQQAHGKTGKASADAEQADVAAPTHAIAHVSRAVEERAEH